MASKIALLSFMLTQLLACTPSAVVSLRADGGAEDGRAGDGGVEDGRAEDGGARAADGAVDAGAADASSPCAPAAARAALDLPYAPAPEGEASQRSLDVYTPAQDDCARAPVVIWVHGGGWAIGDKGNRLEDKRALFNGAGWVLVSINYRLSPQSSSGDPGRVMHPTHAVDVAAAVAWVHAHIESHGGDPGRIALLGHSAGAHLAALVATDASFLAVHGLAVSALRCVGSYDTEAYDIPAALASASADQHQIYENAFGTDPAVLAAASPINHVAAGLGIPPFELVLRGGRERQALVRAFEARLTEAGVPVTVIDAQGLSHEEVNERIGQPGDAVMTPRVTAFLEGCLSE